MSGEEYKIEMREGELDWHELHPDQIPDRFDFTNYASALEAWEEVTMTHCHDGFPGQQDLVPFESRLVKVVGTKKYLIASWLVRAPEAPEVEITN